MKAKDPRPSSHHRWFEQRGDACTLLVFTDDATSKLMQLRFVPSESTDSYFEVYDFADRPLEVRWKGHSLPYRVFSKDQRASHTATVEDKRLGHALTIVKAQQETRRLPAVLTNSDKGGYQKRGRQLHGPEHVENLRAPEAAEICKIAKTDHSTHSHSTTATTYQNDLH